MNWYIEITKNYPLIMAMIQFAILGTLGESFSVMIKEKSSWPFGIWMTIKKMITWAILGVFIKIGFTGTIGFTQALIEHSFLLDSPYRIVIAIERSVILCIFVGFVLVIFHRFLDNIMESKNNWTGIIRGMKMMLFPWIPLHTLTFWAQGEFRMGIAALWSLVLSIMLTLIKTRGRSTP